MAVQEPAPPAQPSSFSAGAADAAVADKGLALPASNGAALATFAETMLAKYETLLQKSAGLAEAKSVRSVERGRLKPKFAHGATTPELPLDAADMILVDK